MDEENHVSLKVTCANRNFSDSPALRGKIHNLLRVLTLFYILSRGKTASTCHGAAGNQGVSCPQRLRSRGLPRNQRECGNFQHPTYQALLELGHAVKTVFLCRYLHEEALRREIHEGLQVIENWNSANSFIFYGRGGEIASNRQEDQELALLALHLLQITMVYINTLMIQQVLTDDTWWARMTPEDLRALTPLIYAHVTPYGTFKLDMQERLPLAAA
jgi:hypothetical protein